MKYLFSEWKGVAKTLRGKFIYLFLDYDGTLAPIVETPGRAAMPDGTKDLLRRLSKMPDRKIAIISGRALRDISKRVGLKNIVYVGNHGFEIKGAKINFKSPVPPQYRKALEEIKNMLKKKLSLFNGVFVEDKGSSLSVHYRLADREYIPAIISGFYNAIFPYEFRNNVQVKRGKMVLEVRPPIKWDKGKAVLWLLERQRSGMGSGNKDVMPVYIGDDVTDEDAFASLKDRGITIFVGKPKKTQARFRLKDTDEVAKLLQALSDKLQAL